MSEGGIPLHKRPPSDIDTELGQLHEKVFHLTRRQSIILVDLHNQTGDKYRYVSRSKKEWGRSDEETLQIARRRVAEDDDKDVRCGWGAIGRSLTSYDEVGAQIATVTARIGELDDEYDRRGGWTRAFIVRGNDGHIHSSMKCRTCRWNTQFGWLPQYSGRTEAEIVEDAGRMACTVCYPSAPVEALGRPSKIEKIKKFDA